MSSIITIECEPCGDDVNLGQFSHDADDVELFTREIGKILQFLKDHRDCIRAPKGDVHVVAEY